MWAYRRNLAHGLTARAAFLKKVRRVPLGVCDAILKGALIAPGNRHTYASFIDNGLIISSGGGCKNILFP